MRFTEPQCLVHRIDPIRVKANENGMKMREDRAGWLYLVLTKTGSVLVMDTTDSASSLQDIAAPDSSTCAEQLRSI